MGTNFSWTGDVRDLKGNQVSGHIGKRYAFGMYCWSCGLPETYEGGKSVDFAYFFDPHFGEAKENNKSAFVELGVAEPRNERPEGIASASIFTWAQDPSQVRGVLQRYAETPAVEDEYGRRYTGAEFLLMLEANCPIEDTKNVGQEFS